MGLSMIQSIKYVQIKTRTANVVRNARFARSRYTLKLSEFFKIN